MRGLILILVLLAVGIGITGFALGWWKFSTTPNDQTRDITLTVDPEKMKKDRDAVLDVLQPSPKHQKTDVAADAAKKKARDEFQQSAETRFKAIDLNLVELKAKAKNGEAVTKEKMNEAIADLTKKTATARKEWGELKTAAPDQWQGLKNRLGASLDELESVFEKTFSRFMNESAQR